MAVNTRLQEHPLVQKMPKTEREWVQYQNELAKFIFSTLDQMPGQIASERSLLMVNIGNSSTLQDLAPISAADAGATATITIASHVLKNPTGDISYNSGSITGLTHSTTYHVYTDDPDYEGGAVTYVATSDAADLVSAVGRYFVGEVTTPAPAGTTVTGSKGGGHGTLESEFTGTVGAGTSDDRFFEGQFNIP
jgi:hypothetical protein